MGDVSFAIRHASRLSSLAGSLKEAAPAAWQYSPRSAAPRRARGSFVKQAAASVLYRCCVPVAGTGGFVVPVLGFDLVCCWFFWLISVATAGPPTIPAFAGVPAAPTADGLLPLPWPCAATGWVNATEAHIEIAKNRDALT
jgi:hypothetical protein